MSESDCDNFREDHLLRGALGWQRKKRERTSRFGDSAREYFGSRLNRMKKNAEVVDALNEVMESQFGEHKMVGSPPWLMSAASPRGESVAASSFGYGFLALTNAALSLPLLNSPMSPCAHPRR